MWISMMTHDDTNRCYSSPKMTSLMKLSLISGACVHDLFRALKQRRLMIRGIEAEVAKHRELNDAAAPHSLRAPFIGDGTHQQRDVGYDVYM